jgi:hypothetical protein
MLSIILIIFSNTKTNQANKPYANNPKKGKGAIQFAQSAAKALCKARPKAAELGRRLKKGKAEALEGPRSRRSR